MSALAGILRFDPRTQVSRHDLAKLARGIEPIAPDGGAEALLGNLGMIFRAFHTTPESEREHQPLARNGYVFTWDGRLDNREEIQSRIRPNFEKSPTDLDLVSAAYLEWGSECLGQLMGDWALAIWDTGKKQLVLARDFIGVRRLFYRLDRDQLVWSSVLEPLILDSPQRLNINLDYLAGMIYSRPPLDSTPFQEIRSVLPSHFLSFSGDGKQQLERYWSLRPNDQIRYRSDQEYEEHFLDLFEQSVRRRLRSGRTIMAELSGGIDSSSIVCVADKICVESPGASVRTYSYFDEEEPSGDERPYIRLIEQKRQISGFHISKSDFSKDAGPDSLAPLPAYCFRASPGYFAISLRWASLIDAIRRSVGSRVTLSGLGGDELLGGIQYEAAELAQHFSAGKFLCFGQALIRWSLARRKSAFQLVGDMLDLLNARYDPQILLAPDRPQLRWSLLRPDIQHLCLPQFADWRRLGPVQVFMEWARYNLASQLNCIDPPLVGCAEKRYPYLDRALFVFLASIPREQVIGADCRRSLMRRALSGIVPDAVLFRKTKWFAQRSILTRIRDQAAVLNNWCGEECLSDGVIFDRDLLKARLGELKHGVIQEGVQLLSAIAIEHWLRSLSRIGNVDLPQRVALAR